MRDIVATIQPEQDRIVRAGLTDSLCIQGAPGTGKTAVGLHRAAYLLYAYRDQLARSGVLVVGPNDSFLSYIGDVLPALGEIDATQATVSSLVRRATGAQIRGLDLVPAALVKGDARMAEVLRRAVWGHVGRPTEALVVPRGAYQWRVGAYLAEEIDRRADPAAACATRPAGRCCRSAWPTRCCCGWRRRATPPTTGCRTPSPAAAREDVRRRALAEDRPGQDRARLLTDADFLAAAADGILTPDEQSLISMSKPARTVGSARWSLADVILIDEATDLVNRTPSLGHVIVDEAQDLSPMQLRAVGRRASTGSVTVLGDLAQATTPWATSSWAESMTHLGHPDAEVEELVAGFRVPGAVIDFAARLLPSIAPHLTPPHSVRRNRGELDLAELATRQRPGRRDEAALDREGTVGLIVARRCRTGHPQRPRKGGLRYDLLGEDAQIFDARVDLVPASLAKGLEFDHVVLLEPAAIVAGEPDEVTGLRRLYVCLTRAVTSLGGGPLRAAPRPLAADPSAADSRRSPRLSAPPSTPDSRRVRLQKSGPVKRG